MEITYLGHAAFRLRGKDVTVVTDPFPPESGLSLGDVAADIVTISHDSPNHCHVAGVGGMPRIVRGPGEYEIKDVLIGGVATDQAPEEGPVNTAYIFRIDDIVVCHLGDATKTLTDTQVEGIGDIDVLLLPVGGNDVLDPISAATVVKQLEPSFVVPMHYAQEGSRIDGYAPVEQFCREMGAKDIEPEARLTVTRGALPPTVRVVVLQNRGGRA